MILIISGPGGVGKGALVARLLDQEPNLWLSRSWTTRARRPNESADAYVFVDRATFEQRVADGGFYEWAEFLGNLYGTPLPDAPAGHDVLLEIEVQGAEQVLRTDPEALFVLLDAPSRDEQARRLRQRGDTPEQIARRLAKADEEAEAARTLGAVEVVNDDLDRAVAEIRALLAARRG
jgi:guanylate kinase